MGLGNLFSLGADYAFAAVSETAVGRVTFLLKVRSIKAIVSHCIRHDKNIYAE